MFIDCFDQQWSIVNFKCEFKNKICELFIYKFDYPKIQSMIVVFIFFFHRKMSRNGKSFDSLYIV